MIYMKTSDGKLHIVVLETTDIEELMKGRPVKSPDGQVFIACPQKGPRPYHPMVHKKLGDDKS